LQTVPHIRITCTCATIALLALFVCSCGGGASPQVANPGPGQPANPGPAAAPGTGAVYVRLTETGENTEISGGIVAPAVEKALQNAGLKTTRSEKDADLIVHGTVKLEVRDTMRRLGVDRLTYAADASWQLISVAGYRSLLKADTLSEGSGEGRREAVLKTLENLTAKLAAELIPRIQKQLAGR
jgi:hypothetical protein